MLGQLDSTGGPTRLKGHGSRLKKMDKAAAADSFPGNISDTDRERTRVKRILDGIVACDPVKGTQDQEAANRYLGCRLHLRLGCIPATALAVTHASTQTFVRPRICAGGLISRT